MSRRKPATGQSIDVGAKCVELVALAGPKAPLLARVLLEAFPLRDCDQVALVAVAAASARQAGRPKPRSRTPSESRRPR
jgi:hypothetical protein